MTVSDEKGAKVNSDFPATVAGFPQGPFDLLRTSVHFHALALERYANHLLKFQWDTDRLESLVLVVVCELQCESFLFSKHVEAFPMSYYLNHVPSRIGAF